MAHKKITVPAATGLKNLLTKSRTVAKNSKATPADVEQVIVRERSLVKEMDRIQREESGRGISLNEAADKWRIKS